MVTMRQQFVPESNVRTRTFGRLNKKKFITIHETGNLSKGAGAQAHANLQSNTNPRNASWHWSVDDKLAIQSYDHNVSCWAGGDGRGDGNMNSIHIEICVNSDGDYLQAVQNAAELVRYIMKEEDISVDSIVQHNRWSGKNCPTILRNGSRGINWAGFIEKVEGGVVQVSNAVRDYFMLGDDVPGVGILQTKLNKVGHKLTVDSEYGKATEDAVKAFQKTSGLVVDGIAGKATMAKLDTIIANIEKPSTVKLPSYPSSVSDRRGEVKLKADAVYRYTPDDKGIVISTLKKGHTAHYYDMQGHWVRLGKGWVKSAHGSVVEIVKEYRDETLYRISVDGEPVNAFGNVDNILSEVQKAVESGSGKIAVEKV